MRPLAVVVAVVVWLVAACTTPSGSAPQQATLEQTCGLPGVTLEPMLGGRRFVAPVGLVWAPEDANSVYVLEKPGTVQRAGAVEARFADLTDRVFSGDVEEGLLGLAFAPGYPGDATVYLTYTAGTAAALRWRLSRFTVVAAGSPGAQLAPASERVLLELAKPTAGHNGGQLAFGADGYLYVSLGDGGCCNDPHAQAQDTSTLFGALLRLDVSDADAAAPYAIPADNPLVGQPGARPEIWAWGFRNPWRWSFDAATGALWLGDVGQNRYDEIDVVVAGGNFGWPNREGSHCNHDAPAGHGCDDRDFVDPVAELPMRAGPGAVIGGAVYRGEAIPELAGRYVFADFVSGSIQALYPSGGGLAAQLLAEATGIMPSSIGQAPDGELWLTAYGAEGGVHRLGRGACRALAPPPPGEGPPYRFLVADGVGHEGRARAYYAAVLPGVDLDGYDLDAWRADSGAGAGVATVSAFYRNTIELFGWRETTCTEVIAPGVGGCWVRSWGTAAAHAAGLPHASTVGLRLGEAGAVELFVFDAEGRLQPSVRFDDEGEKFVPEVCTPCHGGRHVPGSADLGALFRELDPAHLEPAPGVARADAEAAWLALDQRVRQGNLAATSAQAGFAAARARALAQLDALLAGVPAEVPPSWQAAGEATLWQALVEPYCQPCHRVNDHDLAAYAGFAGLARGTASGTHFEELVHGTRAGLAMPQSQAARAALAVDAAAWAAAESWLARTSDRPRPCLVRFRSEGPGFTVVGQDAYVVGDVAALGTWTPEFGVRLVPRPFPSWEATASIPCGRAVRYRLVVVDAHDGRVIWEAMPEDRALELPATRVALDVELTWGVGGERVRQIAAGPITEVTFEVQGVDFTRWGQDVIVVGDAPALAEGLVLTPAPFPTWRATARVPLGLPLRYRLAVRDRWTGETTWQPAGEHAVPPLAGAATLVHAW